MWLVREGCEGSPSHLFSLLILSHLLSSSLPEILSLSEISSLSGDCLYRHHSRYRWLEGRTAPADVLEIRTSHRSLSDQTLRCRHRDGGGDGARHVKMRRKKWQQCPSGEEHGIGSFSVPKIVGARRQDAVWDVCAVEERAWRE